MTRDADELVTVVFIHGIGGRQKPKKWLPGVWKILGDPEQALSHSCEITLAGKRVAFRNPNYQKTLTSRLQQNGKLGTAISEVSAQPPAVISRDVEARFELARADLLAHLRRHMRTKKVGRRLPPNTVAFAARKARKWVPFAKLPEVKAYLNGRGPQVIELISRELPDRGEVIIIGHSLGSVIALDLLRSIRPTVNVRLLITLGSPLSTSGVWNRRIKPLHKQFPYDCLSAWVNIRSTNDIVTGYQDLSKRIPQVVDIPIESFAPPTTPKSILKHWHKHHNIRVYAGHDFLAHALEWALLREGVAQSSADTGSPLSHPTPPTQSTPPA